MPKLPTNLTEINDDRLMSLLVRFTRYQDHLAGLLALIEIDEHSTETAFEVAKAKHLAKSWTGASSDRVAVQKAEALLDPDVQQLDSLLTRYRSRRKLYTIMVDSMQRGAAVISRELTRRVGREVPERRADRYNP